MALSSDELLSAGLGWLDAHHDIVNALNVFPVPDGDTGTNMLLTMKSALHEITATNANTVGEVARAAAHGALDGRARQLRRHSVADPARRCAQPG